MVGSLQLAAVEVVPYLNAWKALPLLIMLLVWARLITWADKDAPKIHLPRSVTNLIQIAAAIFGFFLFFILPSFLIATLAMVGCILAGEGAYFGMRAQKHGLNDLSDQFKNWLRSIVKKEKPVKEIADELMICDSGGNPTHPPAEDAPERAGYDAMQKLFVPPLVKNADRIDMNPAEGGAKLTYHVDGMSYAGGTATKDVATHIITFFKQCAGLDAEEKRKPQTGKLKTVFNGKKRELQITTAGSTAGEQMMLQSDLKKRHDRKLEDLGFLPAQEEAIREAITEGDGVVLVAAPKQQGLTSIMYAILRAHDAFLTHILTIERAPDQDLEGITQNALPHGASAAEELKQVSWCISQEPDVLAVTSLEDPQSARDLARYAERKRVYVCVRASDAASAISTWRKWIGSDEVAMQALKLVVVGRLVRKLCPQCKLAFAPDPNQLRKMNLDPAEVKELFQARTEPMRDPKGNVIPCDFCHDLHYKGRMGIFEVLQITDEVRQAVVAGGSKAIVGAFRKQKRLTMQEAAIVNVAAGETSLQEISRVLKPEDGGGSGARKPAPVA